MPSTPILTDSSNPSQPLRPSALPWKNAPSTETIPWKVRLERMRRWEFWPSWLYYIPIVFWLIWLSIKHRNWSAFTAANPALQAGGVVGERKHQPLSLLQKNAPDLCARFELLEHPAASDNIQQALAFAKQEGFPVVLKPDVGQRGRGVMIARDEAAVREYLGTFSGPVLVQRYVQGQEFGVFITRRPAPTIGGQQPDVEILSIVHKTFPTVTGDGRSSLKTLITQDARAKLISALLFARWAAELDRVPAKGEVVQLVEIGAHCRGSLFLDASLHATPELVKTLTRLADAVPGYAFGRMDLRVPSVDDFQAGRNLQILEMNGVTAESAHIYHPDTPLLAGYRDMFKQWSLAYEIGSAYAKQGVKTTSLFTLYRLWREDLSRGKQWF